MKEALSIGLFSIYFGVKFVVFDMMSACRKETLIFEFFYSNLFGSCFLFNSSNFQISCSLLPVNIKNISSMNIEQINESPCKKSF